MGDDSGRTDSGLTASIEQLAPADGAVDGFEILERLVRLPISTWRYRWEPEQVRHLGPMAQDWAAAFGLGDSDTRIAAVDANGVALTSIQALHHLIRELRQEVTELHEKVSAYAG